MATKKNETVSEEVEVIVETETIKEPKKTVAKAPRKYAPGAIQAKQEKHRTK